MAQLDRSRQVVGPGAAADAGGGDLDLFESAVGGDDKEGVFARDVEQAQGLAGRTDALLFEGEGGEVDQGYVARVTGGNKGVASEGVAGFAGAAGQSQRAEQRATGKHSRYYER